MSNTFIYEQGWLVEKPEVEKPDIKEYSNNKYNEAYITDMKVYEKYLATLRRFKYDYPDPKKEMELGKDFELKLFDDGSWQGEYIAIKKEDQISIPITPDENWLVTIPAAVDEQPSSEDKEIEWFAAGKKTEQTITLAAIEKLKIAEKEIERLEIEIIRLNGLFGKAFEAGYNSSLPDRKQKWQQFKTENNL